MKLFTAIVTIILLTSSITFADELCDGFAAGYITGYKQSSGSSYESYVPYCPYQPYKSYNDPESDFEHGYIIGLKKGYEEG